MGRLADQIKAADDTRFQDVRVPEWDDPVDGRECVLRVFSMSGSVRAGLMQRWTGDDGRLNVRALYPELLIATCYDPATGAQRSEEHVVFDTSDADWLSQKNSAPLERVATVAMDLSGMGKNAKEEAGKAS